MNGADRNKDQNDKPDDQLAHMTGQRLVLSSPFVAPLVFGWLARRDERRADQTTAQLGYGPALLQALYEVRAHDVQQQVQQPAAGFGRRAGGADRLSARIDALERYLSTLAGRRPGGPS
jgi:Zn-dependent protease with chaperone function